MVVTLLLLPSVVRYLDGQRRQIGWEARAHQAEDAADTVASAKRLMGRRLADLQGTARYVDTNRGTPGPYGSDPAGRFAGVDRTSRNLTRRWTGGARWVQPWSDASSPVRQRTELDVADYDLIARSSFPSEGETRRVHARTQTDVAATAALGLTAGLEWLDERGASTFITAATGPAPVKRSSRRSTIRRCGR